MNIIKELKLEPVPNGGGFIRVIYRSGLETTIDTGNERVTRVLCSSIYFAMTADDPVSYLRRLRSDSIHYFIRGCPMKFTIISPDGNCSTAVLGPDLQAGHQLYIIVPGLHWKMAELLHSVPDDYGLISEVVNPGYECEDNTMATLDDLKKLCPENWQSLAHGICTESA